MTTPGRPSTIHEVARHAGVSHQTVSRYLRGDTGMKPATSDKVREALAALQYTPNLSARSLRSAKRLRLAIVVGGDTERLPSRVLRGASEAARASGYESEVVYSDASGAELAGRLHLGQYAGILALVPLPAEVLDGAGVLSTGVPVHNRIAGVPVHDAGTYDAELRASGALADGAMAERIVEHLADLGHRVFFHVAGHQGWASARNRLNHYRSAVSRLGLESAGDAAGDWSVASGYRIGLEIPSHVTAVVAASDHMALGVLRALHERGVEVPRQVSVTGWDDLPQAAYSVPSLTTVAMDLEAEGRRAVQALLREVGGGAGVGGGVGAGAGPGCPGPADGDDSTAASPMRLIVRESTGPAPT